MEAQLNSILEELDALHSALESKPDLSQVISLLSAWTRVHRASSWIAKADIKGSPMSPSACLASALDDVNSCMASLDGISSVQALSSLSGKCKALGLIFTSIRTFDEWF